MPSFSNAAFDTDAFSTNAWDLGGVTLNDSKVDVVASVIINDIVTGYVGINNSFGAQAVVSDNVKAAANITGIVAASVTIND